MREQLPALLILLPLLAAPVCVIVRRSNWCWGIALAAVGACFLSALKLLERVRASGSFHYDVGGWAAPSGIEYYVDTASASVLLLVAGVSFFALVYARESIGKSIEIGKHYLFYAAWLLCTCGLLGIVITGDAFNVFVFLEISSLSTYMLIGLGKDRRALTASFRYLILGSIGASFILIGIGFLYAATGTLNMEDLAARIPESQSPRAVLVAFTFLTIGLMIKAAVFPLHAWLANAYQHAPIAATTFLAGTATKVSLYVLLRFFYSIFGEEYSFGQMLLNAVLLPAAVAGFLLMSLVAVFQKDLRRMLAFSSVAQIGYIVAGFALATQAGLTAGIVHMFNHAAVKAALFMAVGCIMYRYGHAHIPSLDNLLRRMPLTVTAFIIAGAGLIGVPLTAGFVSKFALIGALLERDLWPVAGLILVSSLMALIYIGRVIEMMVFRRDTESEPQVVFGADEAPTLMLIPLYVLIVCVLYFGIFGDSTLQIASEAAADLLGGIR